MNDLNTSSQSPDISGKFATSGFTTLSQFISSDVLDEIEACIVDLYLLQALKIGEYRLAAQEVNRSSASSFSKFETLYEMMEKDDKEALYQVQKFLPSSQVCRNLFDERFMEIMCGLLGSNRHTVLVDGPALFVNRPNTERLLYKWHSEAHYYPKRRRFVNVWMPLFTDKTSYSGTMSFKSASHLQHFPFSDYQGFNRDSEKRANYFVQYEIPNNFLEGFHEHSCDTQRGDLVIFDRNLVHRSNQNLSDRYSVAMVARVWDPSDDLTLSGNIAVTPYGGNIGRSNLVVEAF